VSIAPSVPPGPRRHDRAPDRPIRTVLFTGPFLERGTVCFASLAHDHPDVELRAIFCQSPGLGLGSRLGDLWRRRGPLALPLAAAALAEAATRWLLSPRRAWQGRKAARTLAPLVRVVPDLHAPEVVAEVEALEPDLGLIYGGPILRPEIFRIPARGTLGIHHGAVPAYRGKKTTFWALYNGEPTAGVTIQRVNEGVDTGDVVRRGEVPTAGRSYRRVWRDVEALGFRLYLEAILAVREGSATIEPQTGEKGPLFGDPGLGELMALPWRRRRVGGRKDTPGAADGEVGTPGLVILTESYHPLVGGGESQARALADAMRREGRPVTVVTRRWDRLDPVRERLDGVDVARVPPSGRGQLRRWGLLVGALPAVLRLRRSRAAFLVSGFRVLGVPAVLGRRGKGGAVILKADSTGEMSGEFFGPGLARFRLTPSSLPVRLFLRMRNRLLRRADAFVAISSVVEEELVDEGVPVPRIHRIPNGVDTRIFRPAEPDERRRLRERLGIPAGRTVVIYTGRLVSYKGLPLLVQVWRRIQDRHPSALLLLVGPGGTDLHNCEAELRQFVDREGLSSSVRFTGAVDNVADYLRASDVFVFPSEMEAFGISVVEAMCCALPVVSTRAGGLRDIVSGSSGAVAVEPGDGEGLRRGLDELLSDPDERRRLGKQGRATAAERYSLEAVRDAYLSLLDQLAPSDGGRE
jgi:L-malate glycosyltransferase